MNQVMKREVGSMATGLLAALVIMGLYSLVEPVFYNIYYRSSPYEPIVEMDGERRGNTIYGTITMEKWAPCDPTGGPPPFFRWEWFGGFVSTTIPMINGRPFAPRNVMETGKQIRVGVISTPLPHDLPPKTPASLALVIVCDRGDGRMRPYRVTPDIEVPAGNGPIRLARN